MMAHYEILMHPLGYGAVVNIHGMGLCFWGAWTWYWMRWVGRRL